MSDVIKETIEFSLLAGEIDIAFEVAEKHGLFMELKKRLNEDSDKTHWNRLASHFERLGKFEDAGDCYKTSQQYDKAMTLYIQTGPQTLQKCISIAQQTSSPDIRSSFLEWILNLDPFVTDETIFSLVDLTMSTDHQRAVVEWTTKCAVRAQVIQ